MDISIFDGDVFTYPGVRMCIYARSKDRPKDVEGISNALGLPTRDQLHIVFLQGFVLSAIVKIVKSRGSTAKAIAVIIALLTLASLSWRWKRKSSSSCCSDTFSRTLLSDALSS